MKPAKLFRLIRATYQHEPMKALRALDDSHNARVIWRAAVERDQEFVVKLLDEITLHKEAFNNLRQPAHFVALQCVQHLRQLQKSAPAGAEQSSTQRREGEAEDAEAGAPLVEIELVPEPAVDLAAELPIEEGAPGEVTRPTVEESAQSREGQTEGAEAGKR